MSNGVKTEMGDCSMEGDAIILSVEHMPILMVMTEMA